MTTYEILSGELVRVTADNRQQAMEQLAEGYYETLEALSEIRSESCDCEQPDAKGWHVVNEAGITFEGLKRAQNEAAQDILAYVLNDYWTRGEVALTNVQEILNEAMERDTVAEWIAAVTCEWQRNTRPCRECNTARVDADIYEEELGLCLTCSNAYWSHDDEEGNE